MKFEDLNKIWLERKLKEPGPACAYISRKAIWRRFWRNLFRNEKALVTCVLVTIVCLAGLPLSTSPPIKAGLGITIIVIGPALLCFSILRLAFRPVFPGLPARQFALKERKRMDAWIISLRWFFWIYFAYAAVMAYEYAFWVTGRRAVTLILMGYYVLLAAVMQITMVRRLRRNYQRGRDALDRFLRELAGEDSCS
jgi:uncharacterized membrane protein (DUF485 family)